MIGVVDITESISCVNDAESIVIYFVSSNAERGETVGYFLDWKEWPSSCPGIVA